MRKSWHSCGEFSLLPVGHGGAFWAEHFPGGHVRAAFCPSLSLRVSDPFTTPLHPLQEASLPTSLCDWGGRFLSLHKITETLKL